MVFAMAVIGAITRLTESGLSIMEGAPFSGALPPLSEAERTEREGLAIGLYRDGDQVYAMEDACPHAGFPLSRGTFENCVIVCDAHGWPFDGRP